MTNPFREALMRAYVRGWIDGRHTPDNGDDGKYAAAQDVAEQFPLPGAAPELLAALKALLDRYTVNTPDGYHDIGGVILQARRAVEKAEAVIP